MVGQTQRPWVRQNPTSCLTQCQTEKKSFRQLRNIYKKQHGARPCMEKMQFVFFVPPKMKVKGYMYPQMKKPVGMLGKVCLIQHYVIKIVSDWQQVVG